MESKHQNMQQPDEFQGIGKQLPYREPTGFFDGLSERTLETAKQRTHLRGSLIIVWRTVAVAASLAAVIFLGFLIQDKETTPIAVVNEIPEIEIPAGQEMKPATAEQPAIVTIVQEKEEPQKEIINETVTTPVNEENVNDVLADLSDEELMELAAMFKADPFLEEANSN